MKRMNCNSIAYRSLYSNETRSRDLILKIASFCPDFSLANIFISQADVEVLLQQPTGEVIRAFDDIMIENVYTRRIHTQKVNSRDNLYSFIDSKFQINSEYCQTKMNKIF